MTAAVKPFEVTKPGVYLDIPDDVYHADPVPAGSLSASGAKRLVPPSCPAIFKWERDNPVFKDTFDFGHAAHKLVLGKGLDTVVVDAEDWRTKAAQAQKAAAHAAGKVPLLTADWQRVQEMADALRRHPLASVLLDPEHGTPEASLFWEDEEAGIWRRSRLDWLPKPRNGRLIIPDYKTAVSADPTNFAKAAMNNGYHQQDAWYRDAAKALDLGADPMFVFIVQEKSAPYLVTVVQLDVTAVRIGRHLNRKAIHTYAQCVRTDTWPGYADDVAHVSLPFWYERQFEEQL